REWQAGAEYQFNFWEHAMSTNINTIRDLAEREYQWGFVTDIEEERVPKGLNEDVIRLISAKKNEPEFMLEWRLKAYRNWASVATTFKEKLAEIGVIFCSFSEAVQKHPELVQKYLGTVVPYTDNFFASLNASVFTDGSFVYVPKGVRCPLELSTYFRINAAETGQFERTLIVADEGSYVSYLEGCTAPIRDENQLHAAVVELIALDDAQIKYSTVQNWY